MFIFTFHGVEQFITRFDRSLTHEQARQLLNHAIDERVERIDKKTLDGADQWHVPSLGVVLITRPTKKRHVIVTVVSDTHMHGPAGDPYGVRESPTLGRTTEELLYAPPLHSDATKNIRFMLDIEFDYTAWGSRGKFLSWLQNVITNQVCSLRHDGMGKVVRARLLEVRDGG